MPPLWLRIAAVGSHLVSRPCSSGTPGAIVSLRLHRCQRAHPRGLHELRTRQAPQARGRSRLEKAPSPASGASRTGVKGPSPEHAHHASTLDRHPSAHERVFIALQQRNPDQLLKAFLNACADTQFIQSIPPTTLTAIFKLLDPAYFVHSLRELHHDLSAADIKQLRIQPVHNVFSEFVQKIGEITRLRRFANLRFGVNEYKYLLSCARAAGDASAAEGVWRDMKMDFVIPDTTCYNHYMAAKCWSGLYHPLSRHKVRVIPYHNIMRLSNAPTREGFDGYQVGAKHGLKAQVLRIFDSMIEKHGLLGDESTFTLLMTAMGREGDIKGCNAILKKLWGVDVDEILEGASPVVKEYPKTSPLRPGTELLMTIVHVYGSNNDNPTAERLLDHISRGYSIPIPINVWSHLQEWAFVLSVPRHGPRKLEQDGASTGKIPMKAASNLWDTMVAEPYNVRPTMPMYNREIKNCANRDMLERMLRLMEQGRRLYFESIYTYRKSKRAYIRAKALYRVHRTALRSTTPIDRMRRKVEYDSIVHRRNRMYIKRWVRLLFRGKGGFRWYRWRQGRRVAAYSRRKLPELIEEWRAFLPEKVIYKTSEGIISIKIR